MSNKTIRAAIYARTSTTDQQSIPAQIEELTAFCERRGWQLTHTFKEQLSGADEKRPERARLLKLIRSHKVDVVLVWKLSRWSRSVLDLLHTVGEIIDAGAAFVSTSEGFDLSTPTGRMVAGMLAVIAQFEREILNENVRMGIAEYRRQNGGKWGRSKTPAHVVDLISRLIENGESTRDIIRASGLPRSTVYHLINRHKCR
jgi:DNA invertase Pin-like site-specific DNA recombinase